MVDEDAAISNADVAVGVAVRGRVSSSPDEKSLPCCTFGFDDRREVLFSMDGRRRNGAEDRLRKIEVTVI